MPRVEDWLNIVVTPDAAAYTAQRIAELEQRIEALEREGEAKDATIRRLSSQLVVRKARA